ncbi:MAG: transcription elongation factor GreA [Thermoleophilaceae bacterium]|nr:transcription elongation factor GreA [Thermoleophilaceae bacterium]
MTDVSEPISQAAYDELEAEIEKLETVDRVAIAKKISIARADGDLKENAEYHAAKNEQSFLETKILQLRERRQKAVIVEPTGTETEVSFGSTVRMMNLGTNKELTYKIVSPYDQDISKGLLSNGSPVAEAITGASEGETVTVRLPNGSENKFKILEIK